MPPPPCPNTVCPAGSSAYKKHGHCHCSRSIKTRDTPNSEKLEENVSASASHQDRRSPKKRKGHKDGASHPTCATKVCPHGEKPTSKDGKCHCVPYHKVRDIFFSEELEENVSASAGHQDRRSPKKHNGAPPPACATTKCHKGEKAVIQNGRCYCAIGKEERSFKSHPVASPERPDCPTTKCVGMMFATKDAQGNCHCIPSIQKARDISIPDGTQDKHHQSISEERDSGNPQLLGRAGYGADKKCPSHQKHVYVGGQDQCIPKTMKLRYSKRQDLPGCEDFSCPTGFIPKLNGDICYCGTDQQNPYPQGPSSLGPHGGLPGNYEQDAPP